MAFPDTFSTERLQAERLTAGHFADLFRMHQDPEQMELLGGVRSEEETRSYLETNLAHWARHGFGLWMLRDPESGAVIGRGLLRHLEIECRDEVEVGYSLDPAYWGRGLATEIATECVRLGRLALGIHSIVALTRPANLASQRVLEKAGLALEREVVHGGEPHLLFRIGSRGT